jgi:hypothetical protein
MKNKFLLLSFAGAALFCGCDKQAQINSEKITILSQKMVQLQQDQSKQMAVIQSELNSLAPMLDKMNDFYFTKSHDDAFFFHTNTLYLLLTVDKKIESRLQTADTEREAENSLAYYYHTNQTDTMYFCMGQIVDAMVNQEKRIENNINAETRRIVAEQSDALFKQIKEAAPDAAETARRIQLAADVAQIKRDLDQIKREIEVTNPPVSHP